MLSKSAHTSNVIDLDEKTLPDNSRFMKSRSKAAYCYGKNSRQFDFLLQNLSSISVMFILYLKWRDFHNSTIFMLICMWQWHILWSIFTCEKYFTSTVMIFFMSRRNTGFSSISISIILIITVMNTKGVEFS